MRNAGEWRSMYKAQLEGMDMMSNEGMIILYGSIRMEGSRMER
jgi:hypothetical protein